jgi:hypothetical protein
MYVFLCNETVDIVFTGTFFKSNVLSPSVLLIRSRKKLNHFPCQSRITFPYRSRINMMRLLNNGKAGQYFSAGFGARHI